MPRKSKTTTLVERQMPDGGWVQYPGTKRTKFSTIPEAEAWLIPRMQPGEILRIARVTGEYYIQHKVVKRESN